MTKKEKQIGSLNKVKMKNDAEFIASLNNEQKTTLLTSDNLQHEY